MRTVVDVAQDTTEASAIDAATLALYEADCYGFRGIPPLWDDLPQVLQDNYRAMAAGAIRAHARVLASGEQGESQ